MKPIRATLRLANNRLVRLREQLGFRSAAAFARAAGIGYNQYTALENMRGSPYRADGDPTTTARQVADFHGASVAYLFPTAVQHFTALPAPVREVEPFELLDGPKRRAIIDRALGKLPLRDRIIIEGRLLAADADDASSTLFALGERLGLSRERTRQLEARALARLREIPELRRLAHETLEAKEIIR